MPLTVKFIGALRHMTGKTKISVDCTGTISLKELILKISQDMPSVQTSLIEQQSDGKTKTNALMLVNDKEISVLNGLDTQLVDGDEVVFVPIVHGG